MVSRTLHIKLEAPYYQIDIDELRFLAQYLEGNGRQEPKTDFQLEEIGQHQLSDSLPSLMA
jgi:hypothetical protein